jgi:ankyrin repeat protein
VDAANFFESIRQGDRAAVLAALDADPSLVSARDGNGLSAVLAAAYGGRRDVAELLAERGAELTPFEMVVVGDEDGVRKLLDEEPEWIGRHTADGWTLLHGAAFFCRESLVRLLLDRGADARAVSTNQLANHPIHAALAGRLPVSGVAMLLDAGGYVNAKQHGGYTALHAAAMHGDTEMVSFLLDRGAHPSIPADDGRTAAAFAHEGGHAQTAALLGDPAEV